MIDKNSKCEIKVNYDWLYSEILINKIFYIYFVKAELTA